MSSFNTFTAQPIVLDLYQEMRWAGHVERAGSGDVLTWFWWENMRERDYLEYVGVDGRIVLKGIVKKQGGAWTGLMWLRTGTVCGSCNRANDSSGR
jgi:hypothetical protein